MVAVLVPGFVGAQGLPSSDPSGYKWKEAGACVVEFVHTPCRTVRSHEYSFGSGFGPECVTRSERVEAFDHDGSESKTWTAVRNRYWFSPRETKKITELILRKENQTVTIDHDKRVYQVRAGGANRGMPYWEEDDSQCSQTKSHYTYLKGRLPDSIVAGIHVVGYSGRDFRGADDEIYFAPSIGCQTMRDQMVMRGAFGWKTGESDTIGGCLRTRPAGAKSIRGACRVQAG